MSYILKQQARKTRSKYAARARAKLKRLASQGFDVTDMIGFDVNKKEFTTRKDYNEWKKAVDNFTDRNNYDFRKKKTSRGLEYLPIEAKALQQRQQQAIQNAVEKREKLDSRPVYNQKGELIGTSKEVKSVVNEEKQKNFYSIPSELDIESLPNRRVLKERLQIMKERSNDSWYAKKDEQMKDNWIDVVGRAHGHDAIDIIERFKNMNSTDFVEMFEMFTSYDFELYASKSGEFLGHNPESQLESMRKSLDMYDRGELDLSLSVFK